jgi:hypothetical protein
VSRLFLPLVLAFLGLILAFTTYRDIRRGGARFYTLEREAILRRASFSLLASVAFFLGAIGFFVYTFQQEQNQAAAAAEQQVEGVVTDTPLLEVDTLPPTPTITPTVDLDFALPTPTATPIVCRGIVEGTGGNGLTLRAEPGGQELAVLPDGSILTLFQDEAAQESGGLTWRRVRTITNQEGWVAQDFLRVAAPCD